MSETAPILHSPFSIPHSGGVSLVIPAKNAAGTLRPCLDAVAPLLARGDLAEIVLVNDRSTDDTARIAESYGAIVLDGPGCGPAAARNVGWRRARSPLVWFIDSDCVAEPDALARLLPHLNREKVGGVGGSYGIMNAESLLACLIHEEIVARHAAMPIEVDYLATFNVVYRRALLEQFQGFDERYVTAEDAELAFRVHAAGYALHFEPESRVKHFHPTRWGGYLRTQRKHGYWRVWLYLHHLGRATGDRYSGAIDHLQPPLAMLALASIPLAFIPILRWGPAVCVGLLAAAQLPMTARLIRRTRSARYALFAPMSFVRAFWRGFGMIQGMLAVAFARLRTR